jgi:Family of unknown function (DUF5764)
MDVGSSENVGIYAEAKSEYTRQLSSYLVLALQKYFLEALDECKEREPDSKKVLLVFQQSLEQIPEWNQEKVQRETHRIIMMSGCDYLEELLTAVFIAHTKVLSAIRLSTRQKKLQITIPKLDHFLHKTFIECARILWTNAFLFAPSGSSIERQKNMRQIEGLLNDGVLQAIRGMLPVKSILKEYLRDEDEDDGEHEDDIHEAPAAAAPEPAPAAAPEPAPVAAPEPAPAHPSVHEEEPVPEPKPESAPVTATPEIIEPLPIPQEEAPKESDAPPPPTIIVDTSNQVNFTNINTIFDTENGENSTMDEMDEDGMDDGDIKILDDTTLPMDDFDEL